jgi:hypothetical protein
MSRLSFISRAEGCDRFSISADKDKEIVKLINCKMVALLCGTDSYRYPLRYYWLLELLAIREHKYHIISDLKIGDVVFFHSFAPSVTDKTFSKKALMWY